MFMVLFVLNNPDLLDDVLAAWERAGVSGATVLQSTGLGRIRQREGPRDDMPLMPGLEDFYYHGEDTSQTLFTIVDREALVKKVIQATEQVVGDLDTPGHGILAVFPATTVRGLIRYKRQRKEAE